jgi:hypothetical protein
LIQQGASFLLPLALWQISALLVASFQLSLLGNGSLLCWFGRNVSRRVVFFSDTSWFKCHFFLLPLTWRFFFSPFSFVTNPCIAGCIVLTPSALRQIPALLVWPYRKSPGTVCIEW